MYITQLHSCISRVLTATGLVNGKGLFLTSHNQSPLTDAKKLVTGDYVDDLYCCAKFRGNPSMRGGVLGK